MKESLQEATQRALLEGYKNLDFKATSQKRNNRAGGKTEITDDEIERAIKKRLDISGGVFTDDSVYDVAEDLTGESDIDKLPKGLVDRIRNILYTKFDEKLEEDKKVERKIRGKCEDYIITFYNADSNELDEESILKEVVNEINSFISSLLLMELSEHVNIDVNIEYKHRAKDYTNRIEGAYYDLIVRIYIPNDSIDDLELANKIEEIVTQILIKQGVDTDDIAEVNVEYVHSIVFEESKKVEDKDATTDLEKAFTTEVKYWLEELVNEKSNDEIGKKATAVLEDEAKVKEIVDELVNGSDDIWEDIHRRIEELAGLHYKESSRVNESKKVTEEVKNEYYYEIHFDYTSESGKDGDGYSKFFKSNKDVEDDTEYITNLAIEENKLDEDDLADLDFIDYAQKIDKGEYERATRTKVESKKVTEGLMDSVADYIILRDYNDYKSNDPWQELFVFDHKLSDDEKSKIQKAIDEAKQVEDYDNEIVEQKIDEVVPYVSNEILSFDDSKIFYF